MRYLLDTNIVSDLVHNPDGEVARHLRGIGDAEVCTSIIVAAELRFGAVKRNSARLTLQVHAVLEALEILAFEKPADQVYAQLRAQLERVGRPIGGNDLLIAAHAMAAGCSLVTDNEREFAQLKSLRWENWLR